MFSGISGYAINRQAGKPQSFEVKLCCDCICCSCTSYSLLTTPLCAFKSTLPHLSFFVVSDGRCSEEMREEALRKSQAIDLKD